jgi:hypothetical protein
MNSNWRFRFSNQLTTSFGNNQSLSMGLRKGRPARASSCSETFTESCRQDVPKSVPAVRIHFPPPIISLQTIVPPTA